MVGVSATATNPPAVTNPPTVVPAAKTLTIPINKVADGKAHFYTYTAAAGTKIRFFVLKSSDNVYRAAFDACDVCFRAKKGYTQEGDFMICNNCGLNFASTKINEVQGGCNPAPLKREIADNNLVLQVSDIEAGSRFF